MDAYTPVSCDFHDEIESLATLRQACQIAYRNESDETVEAEGRINDVYAENKADFLKLEDGTVIRLDRITSINGKRFSKQ